MKQGMIPDKTSNFNLYTNTADVANRMVGVTDSINLIELENMSATLNLAGFAGEIDSPTVGQYKSITVEIPFSNTSKQMLELAAHDENPIIARSAQEFIDPETGNKQIVNRTITMRGWTKKINYGKLNKNGYGEPSIVKETIYYQDIIDGEEVTCIDKLKGRVKIAGVDMTADIENYI